MSRYKYRIDKPYNMTPEIYDAISGGTGEVRIDQIMAFLVSAFNHTLGWGFGDPSCFIKALCDKYGDISVITVMDIIELFYHNQVAPIVIEDGSEFETKYIWMSENEEMRHGFMSDISEEYRSRYFDFKDLMEIEDDYKVITVKANVVAERFYDKPSTLCHKIMVARRDSTNAFIFNSLPITELVRLFAFLNEDGKMKEEYRSQDVLFGGKRDYERMAML